ncbi:gaf domain protein [Flammeovirgaceae bacterium 311]|nr:gaf domain protein [Flammeovirgaceae bacterium 311]
MNISIAETTAIKSNGYKKFLSERYQEADRNTSYFIYGFLILGILIASFYDTWLFAFGVGGACLAAYLLCKFLIPGTLLSRMVISAVFSIFMLQFIGQMHGMYEMHFFFFINIAILIIYQDWRIMLPYTLIAAAHHGTLFGLQMNGYDVKDYIINQDAISHTTIGFHLGLVALMGVVCGWWSIVLQKRTRQDYINKYTLESQLVNMQNNIAFASQISKGNLNASYELHNEDKLGKSLVEMRSSLLEASEKEEQEKFKNVGLAEISDILRNNTTHLEDLANQVLARIIKYMNINQGGLFILQKDEDGSYLELLSSYAYNRKKYLIKKIEIGEGLLGQAALEKDTVYLTDIPQDYISITSGLGEARPNCVLIVPIKSNEEVVGVMEFASFQVFQPYQIKFLEKVSETIASTIISVQVNQQTKLLLEKSQQQAEELRAQEEEMRQNMEEMEATQEEMQRKEIEMRGQLSAIDNTLATIEFDIKGSVHTANDAFLKLIGYSLEEIRGKHHRMFCEKEFTESDEYVEFWKQLQQGISFKNDYKRITRQGKELWLHATYTPVFDSKGYPYKIIKLAFDITNEKQKQLDLQGQVEAINNSSAVIEFTPEGKILRANWIFQDLMKYSENELAGKHHKIFIEEAEATTAEYREHWLKLQSGESVQGEFKRIDKEGKTIWIRGIYGPVLDMNNKVVKVVKLAQNITAEKQLLNKAQQQMDTLDQKVRENEVMQKDLDAYLKALDAAALMSEADIYGNITYVNDRFCEVAKYNREEVIGKPHSILRHPDNSKKLFKEMWATIKSGKVFKGHYPNTAKDGSTYWVDATIEPVLGEDGKPVKYIGIRFDITEQVKREEEIASLLQQANEHLKEIQQSEEELRQNMEEMSATQEELSRKE